MRRRVDRRGRKVGPGRLHEWWHRDIYRTCLICRFKWWRLQRRPEVQAFLVRVDKAVAEARQQDQP